MDHSFHSDVVVGLGAALVVVVHFSHSDEVVEEVFFSVVVDEAFGVDEVETSHVPQVVVEVATGVVDFVVVGATDFEVVVDDCCSQGCHVLLEVPSAATAEAKMAVAAIENFILID